MIAETDDLPTKFARIVVTDDRGRYVVPDLPRANYQVFVRGYGLLDSTRLPAKLGQQLGSESGARPRQARGRAGLSSRLVVVHDYAAGWGPLRQRVVVSGYAVIKALSAAQRPI